MVDRLKVAVFGAGSIGCYVGGQLAAGGLDVTLLGRDRFKADIDAHGLTLTHYERDPIVLSPEDIRFVTDPADICDCDVIIVCVKSQDSLSAAETLSKVAKDGSLIISFQNGVSNPAVLRDKLARQTVLGGVVPFNVTSTQAGQFHCGTEGDLIVQMTEDPRLGILNEAFDKAGQGLKLAPDIEAVQWGKLLVNLNNALSALSGGTLHAGLSQKDYRQALALMMEEGIDVLAGAGIKPAQFGKASPEQTIKILRLPNFLFRIVMNMILKIDRTARSSMLDDLELGRSPEVDYLQGEIVSLAERTGQSAPINAAVLREVHTAFEVGASPKLTGKALLALCR